MLSPLNPGAITRLKEAIRKRDNYKCVDCGRSQPLYRRHPVHRVVPGGTYSFENCETLCYSCHAARHPKGKITVHPLAISDILAKKPFLVQTYSDELEWLEPEQISGLRKTLRMNLWEFASFLNRNGVKCGESTICRWESGKTHPTFKKMFILNQLKNHHAA